MSLGFGVVEPDRDLVEQGGRADLRRDELAMSSALVGALVRGSHMWVMVLLLECCVEPISTPQRGLL